MEIPLVASRRPVWRPGACQATVPQMCILYVYSCRYYLCTTNILHMYYMSTTYIYIYTYIYDYIYDYKYIYGDKYIYILVISIIVFIYIYIRHIRTYIHIFILTCVLPIPVIWHSDNMLPMPLPCPPGFTWDFRGSQDGRQIHGSHGWVEVLPYGHHMGPNRVLKLG